MSRRKFRPEPTREPLAIDPTALDFFFLTGGSRDTEVTESGIAIVSVEGPLEYRGGFFDSYEKIHARIDEAMEDEDTRAVVLRIDSPGGTTDGLNETISRIRVSKERHGKPLIAFADEMAASAAYALTTACDEVYLPRAAGVGSIGVIACLYEQTAKDRKDGIAFEVISVGARKADGNPHLKISEGARARVTARVNQLAEMFFAEVREARGLSIDKIRALEANVFYGADAVKKGLADGVMSLDELLEALADDLDGAGQSGAVNRKPLDSGAGSRNVSMAHSATAHVAHQGAQMLKLKQAKRNAEKALAKAKTKKEIAAAKEALTLAITALAKHDAKMTYKKTTKVEKEEDDSAAEGDDEEEEEEEDDAPPHNGRDDEEEEEEDHDDEEEEEDDADAEDEEPSKDARSSARFLRSVTGAKSTAEARGIVRAALDVARNAVSDVKKIKAQLRGTKVGAMLDQAQRDGKVTKAMIPSLKAIGERSPKELRAMLAAMPAQVRTLEAGAYAADPSRVPTTESAASGTPYSQDEVKMAASLGKTPDEIRKAQSTGAKTAVNGKGN
jgi:signal peptide peptidase SppA